MAGREQDLSGGPEARHALRHEDAGDEKNLRILQESSLETVNEEFDRGEDHGFRRCEATSVEQTEDSIMNIFVRIAARISGLFRVVVEVIVRRDSE